jgi:hypothetical protein
MTEIVNDPDLDRLIREVRGFMYTTSIGYNLSRVKDVDSAISALHEANKRERSMREAKNEAERERDELLREKAIVQNYFRGED